QPVPAAVATAEPVASEPSEEGEASTAAPSAADRAPAEGAPAIPQEQDQEQE
ncbi:MAG: hypothetical protein JWR48_4370, partial [Mycobacterium sp.]|nr:hypothetical protein [Mycobacterium sp.]